MTASPARMSSASQSRLWSSIRNRHVIMTHLVILVYNVCIYLYIYIYVCISIYHDLSIYLYLSYFEHIQSIRITRRDWVDLNGLSWKARSRNIINKTDSQEDLSPLSHCLFRSCHPLGQPFSCHPALVKLHRLLLNLSGQGVPLNWTTRCVITSGEIPWEVLQRSVCEPLKDCIN